MLRRLVVNNVRRARDRRIAQRARRNVEIDVHVRAGPVPQSRQDYPLNKQSLLVWIGQRKPCRHPAKNLDLLVGELVRRQHRLKGYPPNTAPGSLPGVRHGELRDGDIELNLKSGRIVGRVESRPADYNFVPSRHRRLFRRPGAIGQFLNPPACCPHGLDHGEQAGLNRAHALDYLVPLADCRQQFVIIREYHLLRS
jgi:hypothetical protein